MKIAFYNPANPTFIEKEIRAVTKGPYVHSEYVFDDFGPDKDGKLTSFSSVLNIGSRVTQLEFDPKQWVFVDLPKGNFQKAFDYANGLSGRMYNSVGILNFVLPLGEHDPHAVFCSESCVRVIQYTYGVGILFPEQKPWLVSPMLLRDLLDARNKP